MEFFRKYTEEARRKFYEHVRPEVQALAERAVRITKAEHKQLRGNSWEWRLLDANLETELLCERALYYLDNAGVRGPLGRYEICDTYSQALMRLFVPLLVERLQEANAELRRLREALSALGLCHCIHCGVPLSTVIVGAGDGSGNKFSCQPCSEVSR